MTCPSCGTGNSVFETRCTRCGTRFTPAAGSAGGRAGSLRERPGSALIDNGYDSQGGLAKRPFLVNSEARYSTVISNSVVVRPSASLDTSIAPVAPTRPGLTSAESTARQLDERTQSATRSNHALSPNEGGTQTGKEKETAKLRVAPPSAQPSLFQQSDLKATSGPMPVSLQAIGATHSEGPLPRRKPTRRRTKSDVLPFAQGTLDFLTPTTAPSRQLRTTVEAAVLCDQSVASPMHRSAATLVDAAYLLLFNFVMWATFYFAAQHFGIPLPANPMALYLTMAASFAVVTMLYKVLFICFDEESLGCKHLELQVMCMDGTLPERSHRWKRLLGTTVSAAAAGAGFVWALFDEEHLGWPDHISGTFPTPKSNVGSSFRRT